MKRSRATIMCKGNYAEYVRLNMPYLNLSIQVHPFIIMLKSAYIIDIMSIFPLTNKLLWHNYLNILCRSIICSMKGDMMDNNNSKVEKLKEHGVLNPRPQQVKDELFQKYDFFDPQDLLQVKYEMVRRVQKDGWTVGKASRSFGFSRPSYYEAQNSFNKIGLPGLIPRQRGPKAAHKLSDEVMKFIEQAMDEDTTLRALKISSLVEKRFDLSVHPRSIERALARRKKKQK